MSDPWDIAKRARIMKRIGVEAERAAKRLGAGGCVIIAFFPDGKEHMHVLDAGNNLPMPLLDIYKKMVTSRSILTESGGEDVAVQ